MNSGVIVERRDHVLMGRRSFFLIRGLDLA